MILEEEIKMGKKKNVYKGSVLIIDEPIHNLKITKKRYPKLKQIIIIETNVDCILMKKKIDSLVVYRSDDPTIIYEENIGTVVFQRSSGSEDFGEYSHLMNTDFKSLYPTSLPIEDSILISESAAKKLTQGLQPKYVNVLEAMANGTVGEHERLMMQLGGDFDGDILGFDVLDGIRPRVWWEEQNKHKSYSELCKVRTDLVNGSVRSYNLTQGLHGSYSDVCKLIGGEK